MKRNLNFIIAGCILLVFFSTIIYLAFYSIHSAKSSKQNEIPSSQIYMNTQGGINNFESVFHYAYENESSSDGKMLILKDVPFSFLDDLNIPGMPQTKGEDFSSNRIFSESQCPQGICLTDDFILISSYSDDSDCLGELLVFDKELGEYLFTLGMDPESHLGGITFDGKNVWVCNSARQTIERISYDFIQLMAIQNKGEYVDATDVVDIYKVENTPSCITFYGDRLWIATHSIYFDSKMVAYHYDHMNNELISLHEYHIPSKVQGVTFTDDGKVFLSISYGRRASSYLMGYSSIISLSTKPKKPLVTIEMPPCSEEIEYANEMLYIIFESAGDKYFNGTDGKGTSDSPIDKILILPLSSILQDYK